jgi:steroid 5-alpha reductase family enzyme
MFIVYNFFISGYTPLMEQAIALYITSLIITLGVTSLLYFIAQFKKDNSIMDIAYGLIFLIVSYELATKQFESGTLAPASIVILFLMTVWGIRLSLRIFMKNRGKPEDARYAAWRKEWLRHGAKYYLARAYLQIFILQGVVISIVLLPFTMTLTTNTQSNSLLLVGLVVWLVGFIFEAVGDRQLDTFLKKKSGHEKIMKTGLWKYTRHPNYFGESTMWFGIACIAYSSTGYIAVFLSPIVITYLLLKVSGIPMLEKRWEGLPEWEIYRAKTSAFIPLPPK